MTFSVVMQAPGSGTILPLEAMNSPNSARERREEASRARLPGAPGSSVPSLGRIGHMATPTGGGWEWGWWAAESWAQQTLPGRQGPHQPLSARLQAMLSLGLKVSENQGPPPQSGDHSRMKKKTTVEGA